jgi:mannose-6-phosphate isomerase-like protein (cupin superfamily)
VIKKFSYKKDKLKKIEFREGKVTVFTDVGLNEPGCIAAFEELRPDVPMKESWPFWFDEFHYVIKGKAEITFTSPPFHEKEEKIVLEAGDAYYTPIGTIATWKILSAEPFLHLNVVMPRPESFNV